MNRVAVLGRGGAGKSTFARSLGVSTGLPVVELDKHFWSPDLSPMPIDEWISVQRALITEPQWILDGDLGRYDVLEPRLRAADTVVILDFALWRCASRAVRRSRENLAFWRWLFAYRHRSLPVVLAAIAEFAGQAEVHRLRSPREAERYLRSVG